MRFLVPGAVALSFLSAAFADESTLIFDARLNLWPAQQIAQAELAFLQREVRPAARRAWGSWDACSDEFEVLDVASGAFTEPGATEKAYLYRYCLPGRQIGAQGITVVRNDRVVWHVAYQGGSDTAIGALSDINRDGLSEIVVAGGGTGQGYVIGGITLLELTPNGVMAFGRATTYEDDCGTGKEPGRIEAKRLFVRPGIDPIFLQETFAKTGCNEKARWVRQGAPVEFALDADDTQYRRLF